MDTKDGNAIAIAPADYRRRIVNGLELIGCWPKAGAVRPNMDRVFMRREISRSTKFLNDDELLAVMWMVNALSLPSRVDS